MTKKDTMKKTTLFCAVADFDVSKNGIKDYYWPISTHERMTFASGLCADYCDFIRNNSTHDDNDLLPYKIYGTRFLAEVVAIFQGELLRERTLQDQVDVIVPEDWTYWPKIIKRNNLAPSKTVTSITQGPTQTNYSKRIFDPKFLKNIFKLLKLKKRGLGIENIKIKPLTKNVLDKSIIALQRTELIIKHAENIDKEVIFCRSNKWFESVSKNEIEQNIKAIDDLIIDEIISLVQKNFKRFSISLKPENNEYLTKTLKEAITVTRIHYEKLLKKKESLPAHVWTGTTGHYWDTLLRLAVMENGGISEGHDHGSGWSYLTNPLRGINELWGCHNFFTFNEFHASEMTIGAKHWPLYESKNISIKPVPSLKTDKINNFERFKLITIKPRKVFVMATLFDNDRGRIGPGNVNNFIVDWQARLVTYLKKSGYDVVLKIHPENKFGHHPSLSELGAEITSEPFTNIMEQADVVLFDCIYTTAFTDCLKTNVPMVLIDFFGFPWTETGLKLIKNRSEIIEADYRNNRAYPDWDKIDAAIGACVTKSNNHDFYKTYFL